MTWIFRFWPAFVLVAVIFAFDPGTGLGPETAWAQTASDLRCRQCVNRREIRKGAVKFNRLQGKVQNRITDLETAAAQRVPFYITLDGNGAEQTIATNGPLTVLARCLLDDSGRDRAQIIFTSSVAGWFAVADPNDPDNTGPFPAFQEVVSLQQSETTGTPGYDDDQEEGSAVAPDGSVVGIAGEATGMGVNIFGHDCLAIGNVFLVNGTP